MKFTASILKVHNLDTFSPVNLKVLTSHVYTHQEIDNQDIIYANSLNTKVAPNHVYTKTEVELKVTSLFGAAPAVLGTSIELASALGNGPTLCYDYTKSNS